MGSDRGEFWWRIWMFNEFGHQSRFVRPFPAVLCFCAPFITGHFVSVVMVPPTQQFSQYGSFGQSKVMYIIPASLLKCTRGAHQCCFTVGFFSFSRRCSQPPHRPTTSTNASHRPFNHLRNSPR